MAKPGAPLAISVMGRYSQFFDDLGRFPAQLGLEPAFYRRALDTGDYDGSHGFAPCHFYLPEELEAELAESGLRVAARAGLEGLASYHASEVNRLAESDPAAWATWKALHLETCTRPEVVATSSHFLLIGHAVTGGRRRSRPPSDRTAPSGLRSDPRTRPPPPPTHAVRRVWPARGKLPGPA